MAECKHQKVYADHILLSHPPQRPWICGICLDEGVDTELQIQESPNYYDLKRRLAQVKDGKEIVEIFNI